MIYKEGAFRQRLNHSEARMINNRIFFEIVKRELLPMSIFDTSGPKSA